MGPENACPHAGIDDNPTATLVTVLHSMEAAPACNLCSWLNKPPPNAGLANVADLVHKGNHVD
jgi:hypothetical protein